MNEIKYNNQLRIFGLKASHYIVGGSTLAGAGTGLLVSNNKAKKKAILLGLKPGTEEYKKFIRKATLRGTATGAVIGTGVGLTGVGIARASIKSELENMDNDPNAYIEGILNKNKRYRGYRDIHNRSDIRVSYNTSIGPDINPTQLHYINERAKVKSKMDTTKIAAKELMRLKRNNLKKTYNNLGLGFK